MRSFFKKVVLACMLLSAVVALAACGEEGDAEKAGKEIDKTFDSVKEKVHEATK
jgi:predicted small lipoprotein YifL